MTQELEELSNTMALAFSFYNLTPSHLGPKREQAWDAYVIHRESFLRASAKTRGLQYRALKDQLVIDYNFISYKKEIARSS